MILPAFRITVGDMVRFSELGCTLVDTTCGSVLNVWKNVVRYAQDGFTAIIHGKVKHEETRATASQALKYPQGRYLVVLDRDEAAIVRPSAGAVTLRRSSRGSARRCRRASIPTSIWSIGCANRTTMLMSESLEIGEMFGAAMRERYGGDALGRHFRAFDTICSATQERQDAVEALLDTEPVGLMLVVGGYNSSNTFNLARICAARARTYHISDPACLLSAERIRHRPIGAPSTAKASEVVSENWLGATGPVTVGLTAGASTPNNIVGQVIETLERLTSA